MNEVKVHIYNIEHKLNLHHTCDKENTDPENSWRVPTTDGQPDEVSILRSGTNSSKQQSS